MPPYHLTITCAVIAWSLDGMMVMAREPDSPPRPPPVILPSTASQISVADAQLALKQGKLAGIVDLRTPEEVHASGFLPGARFVSFFASDFDQAILRLQLDPNRPCLLYCALGGRAARAAKKLHALGFKEVLVLQGGFEAWRRAGGELSQ